VPPRRVRRREPAQPVADDGELERRIDALARNRVSVRPLTDEARRSPWGAALSRLGDDFQRERAQLEGERAPLADQLAQLRAFLDDGEAAIDHLPKGSQ
jgi:hypothetical protein